MAYLSDDDEQSQQDAAKGQDNFDLSSKVSSSTSDQQSQQNAGSYDQSYGGNTGPSKASASSDKSGNNSTGLGSSTPGGGYVNFSAFENANPDQSKQIATAGSSLVGSETGNFNSQTSADPDSGFSTDPNGAPGWDGGTYHRPVNSLTSGVAGGSAPDDPIGMSQPPPPTIEGLASGGTASDLNTLGGWVNEKYTAPSYDYTPSTNWQTYAPELSETPTLGGQGKPSVVDYLAKDNIAAGNYSNGDRALDNAIVSGNANDQAAITGNQQKFGKFATDVGSTLTSLNNRVNYDTNAAPGIASGTAGALGSLSNDIMNQAAGAAAGVNAGQSADTTSEVQAFNNWYNGPTGPGSGGVWSGNTTAPTQETADQALTPAQATELNNIATAMGQPPPYPNGPTSGGASPGSVGGQGVSAPPPADPSIATQTQKGPGSGAPIDVGTVYNMIGTGSPAVQSASNNYWMTPQEMTVSAVMNPGQSGSYPPVTQAGLQSALSQLEGVLAGEQAQPLGGALNASAKASNISAIQKEIGAIQTALKQMSPSSPYAYGLSLGMTPEQLQQMGINPPTPFNPLSQLGGFI